MENWYNTDFPLILYNTEYKSGGVQKLSGAVFCTAGTAEKLTVSDQTNGESVRKTDFSLLPEQIVVFICFNLCLNMRMVSPGHRASEIRFFMLCP